MSTAPDVARVEMSRRQLDELVANLIRKVNVERSALAIDLALALGGGREALGRAAVTFVALDCAVCELIMAVARRDATE